MCNTLYLPLKKKWFDMIKSGEKKEEYREIKDSYIKRFCKEQNPHQPWLNPTGSIYFKIRDFEKLILTLGYPKATDTERRLEFNNPKIRIGEGKPEWGAEPGKKYFVITWDN